MPFSLVFQRFQLHLISLGAFTRQDVFTLKIAVHHDNRGLIIIQIPDNGGDFFNPSQLAGSFPPVSGHDLIASVIHGTHDDGHQHTILPDAFHSFLHPVIIYDAEWMILEGHKLGKRKRLNPLIAALTGFLRREDTIE